MRVRECNNARVFQNEKKKEISVLDLFSGIGGFTIAGELANAASERRGEAWGDCARPSKWTAGIGGKFRTIAFSEIDKYASAVLAHRFPSIPNIGSVCDITRDSLFSATGQRTVDIITGGFPCQPHSVAGLRKANEDDRDLWSECARLLRDIRPRFALFENVGGLLTSEDISSDGERASGLFFNRVLSDLAFIGYGVLWQIVPASAVGAPHRRDRVWIICVEELVNPHCSTDTQQGLCKDNCVFCVNRKEIWGKVSRGADAKLADTDYAGGGTSICGTDGDQSTQDIDGRQPLAEPCGLGIDHLWPARPGQDQYRWESPRGVESGGQTGGHTVWAGEGDDRQVKPDLGGKFDGLPPELDSTPVQFHAQSPTENRVGRLKALGNAIVPQVAATMMIAIRNQF